MSKHSTRNQGFSLRRILLQTVGINEGNRNTLNDAECGETSFENHDKNKSGVRPANSNSLCDKSTVENPQFLDENICNICFLNETQENPFFTLNLCQHKFCITCLNRYLKNEISESRTDIACPQCSSAIHPNNIDCLLHDFPEIKLKYEDFMIRRYLVTDPDSRWCPAPDCSYAVIATGCASCPQLQCERKACGTSFCYHCKALWHPDQTCDAARNSRQKSQHVPSNSFNSDPTRRDEIKPCPRCQVLIVKMNDGSCNHMSCSLCGAEFCWLCMKEVSDLHYLSPSGCTFWGKKPWSRKKKIVWQIGTLIGAPVGIALLAGIAVPLIVIGIPVWAGRKLLNRYKSTSKKKRNISVAFGVIASILISPILAGLAIAIGVPILLFYVYGIVPVSLFRAGCANANNENFKYDDNIADRNANPFNSDSASIGAGSKLGETSLGDVSVSAVSGSIIDMTHNYAIRANQHSCRESTTALAGSVENHKIDGTDTSLSKSTTAVTCSSSIKKSCSVDTSSAIALAGSITSSKQ